MRKYCRSSVDHLPNLDVCFLWPRFFSSQQLHSDQLGSAIWEGALFLLMVVTVDTSKRVRVCSGAEYERLWFWNIDWVTPSPVLQSGSV